MEKGFVLGLVIGIAVIICIAGFPLDHAYADSAPTTDNFSVLYSFGSVANDGAYPLGSLTLSGSTFYGMTNGIGDYADSSGTIFRINVDGTGYQVLYNFGSVNNGTNPQGDLTVSGSTLYGMTLGAGTRGSGTIFKINTDGTGYQVLHSFGSVPNDGSYPYGSLTLSGTTLYGMTPSGGANGKGTIFQINTDGSGYQVLYSFGSIENDGFYPYGSLTLSGTTLYGMTSDGGANGAPGTIFQINTDGTGYRVLYSFGSVANDGTNPYGSLTLSGSMLYGMTETGGAGGFGTIFQINTSGAGYQVMYSFAGYPNDGYYPLSSLTVSGSTLYGATRTGGSGGAHGLGSIFQINTDGTGYQVLHDFGSPANYGCGPNGFTHALGVHALRDGLWGRRLRQRDDFLRQRHACSSRRADRSNGSGRHCPGSGQLHGPGRRSPRQLLHRDLEPRRHNSHRRGKPDNRAKPDQRHCLYIHGNGDKLDRDRSALKSFQQRNALRSSALLLLPLLPVPGTLPLPFPVLTRQSGKEAQLPSTLDGTFGSVSITDNNGNPDQVINSGTSAFWSSPGGLFLTTGQPNNILCQIDSGNTVIACTETDLSDGSPRLLIFTKQASSCSLADLTGAWEGNFLTSMGQYSGAAETDSLTINPNGTWTDSSTGGTGAWSISPIGVITNLSDTTFSGVMDADRTVMVATSGANTSPARLNVYAKQAASYLPEDLAGTWQGNSLSMWTWERDTLTINEEGTFTMSSTVNDGSTNNNITGTCTLSPYGGITLVVNSGSSQSIVYGDMAADKTVIVTTAQSSINDFIEIFTKNAAGSLTVTISPAGAVSAGAMWSVDGGSWQAGGTTVSGLTVGPHTVAFNNIAGWTTPSSQTFNISNGQTTSLSGTYVQQTGSLTVAISPAGAVTEGAMWSVDGGSWHASGTTVSGITVGSHTVAYNNIPGWNIPPGQTTKIWNGQPASAIGTYLPVFTAIFSASATSGKAPLTVHFTDSSVGSIAKWFWNFGDGKTSTVRNPSHTYSKAGAYTVTLTVTGAGGINTCTQPDCITVYDAPKANFSASPSSGKAPLQVNFTNESTGLVTSWLWSFGDGATSTDVSPVHTYNRPGTFTAKLTVYGPGGTGSKTLSIRVRK